MVQESNIQDVSKVLPTSSLLQREFEIITSLLLQREFEIMTSLLLQREFEIIDWPTCLLII